MSLSLVPTLGTLFARLSAIVPSQVVSATTTVRTASATATAATTSLTATVGTVSTTATVPAVSTRASAQATPIGAGQIPQGNLDPGRVFSPDYLTQPAQQGIGGLSLFFFLLSLVVLAVGAYFYFVGRNRWRRVHRLNYRVATAWSLAGMILGAIGVLFMIFRFLGIEGLNSRIWLYLVLLGMVAVAAYAAFFFRMRYPAQLATYNRSLKPRSAASGRARNASPRPAGTPDAPPRQTGSAGNPRGTSARGERRREKKR